MRITWRWWWSTFKTIQSNMVFVHRHSPFFDQVILICFCGLLNPQNARCASGDVLFTWCYRLVSISIKCLTQPKYCGRTTPIVMLPPKPSSWLNTCSTNKNKFGTRDLNHNKKNRILNSSLPSRSLIVRSNEWNANGHWALLLDICIILSLPSVRGFDVSPYAIQWCTQGMYIICNRYSLLTTYYTSSVWRKLDSIRDSSLHHHIYASDTSRATLPNSWADTTPHIITIQAIWGQSDERWRWRWGRIKKKYI